MSNTTTITGNLTREPEIRYTREGQATAQLGVAVNRRWQDRTTQEWQEATSFFDVVCWRDLAENVALSLTKGMRVVVTGRLEQRSWETDEGEHRSKVEIVADEIGPSLRFATADVQRVERRRRCRRVKFLASGDLASPSRSRPAATDPGSAGVVARPDAGSCPAESHRPHRITGATTVAPSDPRSTSEPRSPPAAIDRHTATSPAPLHHLHAVHPAPLVLPSQTTPFSAAHQPHQFASHVWHSRGVGLARGGRWWSSAL